MNPFILAVWLLFAAAIMSPVGYWVARAVRRMGAQRRLRPLHEPLVLPAAPAETGARALVERTLALRERLRAPLLQTDDYVGALPILEIALHLSRAVKLRSGWGARMRQEFEDAVGRAYAEIESWIAFTDAQDDATRDTLVALGLSTAGIRNLVEAHQKDASGWARDFGTAEDARRVTRRLESVMEELDAFARRLVEGQRDPYR